MQMRSDFRERQPIGKKPFSGALVPPIIVNEPTRTSDMTSLPHFKRSGMFFASESEKNMDATRKAVAMVALVEYQALQNKYVLHLVTSLPSVSNASHVSNTPLKQAFIQYCTHNKTDSHTRRQ